MDYALSYGLAFVCRLGNATDSSAEGGKGNAKGAVVPDAAMSNARLASAWQCWWCTRKHDGFWTVELKCNDQFTISPLYQTFLGRNVMLLV